MAANTKHNLYAMNTTKCVKSPYTFLGGSNAMFIFHFGKRNIYPIT